MPETKLAITRINRLNPLRLGKDGYVLRIEKAIEETTHGIGQTLTAAQKKRAAMVMAQGILRSTIELTETDANDAEEQAPRQFKRGIKTIAAAGTAFLASLGVWYYAKHAGFETGVEISKAGFTAAFSVSIYGLFKTTEGTFCFGAAKILKRRTPKFTRMADQLGREIADSDIAKVKDPHWKS